MKTVGKKKKAQQLIEFLLVVPFMVIILGILTEYAYALNINMTLSEGLKTVTASIYSEINPSMSTDDIKTTVTQNLIKYLSSNNAPTNSENNIQVGYTISGQTAVFMARYTYIPAFTLPNVYFKFMPDEFNFLATAAVPAAFLGANNYDASLTATKLDGIWGANDFSNLASFDGKKYGIMKDNSSGGRSKMIFLVQTNVAPGLVHPYELVLWDGSTISDGNNIYTVDTNNGKLYKCSSSSCVDLNQKFFNYLTENNYYNVIFIHDNEVPNDLDDLTSYWISDLTKTDLSDTTVNGILKRALALSDLSTLSVGNYDNIEVSAYNSDISGGNSYTVNNFGSMIFVYTNADDISNIINGGSMPKINDGDWK